MKTNFEFQKKYKKMPKRCQHCPKQPSFNYEGESPKYCAEHKEEGMGDVRSKRCQHKGCLTHPNFNYEGETTPKYCAEHKEEGMINVKHKNCQHERCKTRPSFGYKGLKPKYCSKHKEEGMIDVVRNRWCNQEGCSTYPIFNYEGEVIPKYCVKHKEEGMVDVINRRCQYEGCSTHPNFNYEGEMNPKYCVKHKEEGMINVISNRCQYEGCLTQPSFNYEGELPKYCVEHKEEGMTDVKSKRCQYEGCSRQPTFNYEGERPKYCAEHKEEGMIDVKSKRCQYEGCSRQPTFNYEGERPKYCAEHKEEGMVSVLDRRCQQENCKTSATYGLLGNSPHHCAKHAEKRIEIFKPTRRCSVCNELATYGDEYPVRCETHSIPDDVTFEISRCSKCGLQAIINRKGVCYCCDEEKHVRLAKQNETVAYLRAQNVPIESVDRIIDSNCGYERPDIVINSNNGSFKIVVEVDEHQHKHGNYQELCECVRMKNVAEIFFLPTLYIRFNPDEYKTPDLDEVPMKKKLFRLKKVIEKYMNTERLECTIGVIQLYFDGWIENTPVEKFSIVIEIIYSHLFQIH